MCDGQSRTLVDCSAYDNLEHQVLEANAGIQSLGFGLGGRYESEALSQVRESTEQLTVALESACRDYNACVTDQHRYLKFKDETVARLSKHLSLVADLEHYTSAGLGNEIWSNALPEAAAKRLVLSYTVSSRQGARFVPHTSGATLTSGTQLRIALETTPEAYVYVVLITPHENPVALFPNSALGGKNPVRAGQPIVIPPADVSLLLDAQPGTEHLEFIASLAPLTQLESSLRALPVAQRSSSTTAAATAGSTTSARTDLLTDIGKLICIPQMATQLRIAGTRVDCGDAPNRGLVLVKRADSAAQAQIAATPNDDTVVLQHEIVHL